MPNYKHLFKKNLLMMIVLVFFILTVILFINFLYDKKNPNVYLGGSFIAHLPKTPLFPLA